MGWWPFSSESSTTSSTTQSQQPSELLPPTTTSSSLSQTSQTSEPPRSPTPAPPLTRDQQADAELNAFLASFESSSSQPSTTSASPTTFPSSFDPTPPETTTIQPSSPSPYLPNGKLDISPAALRPRTMNCRTLFDSAFYCASLGGKFNDIYRFGTLQPCSEHWDAFWFCMRTKSYNERERGDMIAKYYEEREEREKNRRSRGRTSEDVWEMRREQVEKAFWKVP
ncbi:hypothetical protein B9Z65_2403 [Elsinoe australis]|uniref:Early meiotic induction protein 1 n=1 Tax=Elsinoe australis TaxID=40998 RepID=A0A2P7ZAL7_9PEZI|nr:hypothetical protein B9Z65_2403 [Elsinoe australis]